MKQFWNFSAGPSVLPKEVLQQAAEEMLDWHGSGQSVMEMSHRGAEFTQICDEAEADLRKLLGVGDEWAVFFSQGGASAQNAILPMNLIALKEGRTADYVLTGSWSNKAYKEAKGYGEMRIAASSAEAREIDGVQYQAWQWAPDFSEWQINPNASYLHYCSNETIGGVEYAQLPDKAAIGAEAVPLILDTSSHFLARAWNLEGVDMLYAGAQKNAGPAGSTIIVIRRELIGQCEAICPDVFNYKNLDEARSRFNTPPTYSIYMSGLVFKWLLAQGGLAAIEQQNKAKAKRLYDYIDSTDFYHNFVQPSHRSIMNVPFVTANEALDAQFLKGAKERGLLNLKGHKSVGGMRASIYNAMPIEGVEALIDYMQDFERQHG
ncbi:3-phosphoserine/phosphohydroxythreonine transaminase [Oligella urethralis]|uniref:3-phosphoserine/phosphohydroxythreonine transaminase n=1 Tax=Oligella urethralis TaxID=90245 RepID=UPI00037E6D29|nr:3-phosphoserine/phosphohydroxythreonine transaminase [Oligella urethralis]SUA65990.1 Phosphoserine aminotransferase [Oligella urethralis]